MNISIIVPVYNQSKTLKARMCHLLNQDYEDFELILVDDGSTDGSARICDELENEYDKVKVYHKPNGGVSSARNFGIKKAVGKFIVFCDADDDMESDALSNLIGCMEKTNADLVVGGFTSVKIDNSGKVIDRESDPNRRTVCYDLNKDYIDSLWNENNMLSAWGKLFRLYIILKNDIQFNENQVVLEDYCFVLKYLMCCKNVSTCDKSVYNYYTTNNIDSLSRRSRVDFADDVIYAYDLQKQFFSGQNVKNLTEVASRIYGTYIVSYEWLWTLKTKGIKQRLEKYKRIKQVLKAPICKDAFGYYKYYSCKFEYEALTHGSIIGILICNFLKKFGIIKLKSE